MYTRVAIRSMDEEVFEWDGHAYDISRGGIRFESDRSFDPGAMIVMRIDLPRAPIERSTEARSVFVFANVVWLEDGDQPGPYKMAAVFTRFERPEDEELLMRRISCGRYSLAA
jgi:hypothetical protein